MPVVEFGEWLPDQDEIQAPGILDVSGLLPSPSGWDFFPRLADLDFVNPPDSTVLGAKRGRFRNGTVYVVAGTADGLWVLEGGTWNAHSTAGTFGAPREGGWDFAQWERYLFATNGTDPIQYYDSEDSAQGWRVVADAVGNCAPLAVTIEVVNNFLVAGNLVFPANHSLIGEGQDEAGIQWSGINAPFSWPDPGTDQAQAVQSDWQPLRGEGGQITNIVTAAEWAIVTRERETFRMDYQGDPIFFSFRIVDSRRGAIAPLGAIAVGGITYYYTSEGWNACDGSSLSPIGYEKVDKWTREFLDFDSLGRISAAHVPSTSSVVWAMPFRSNEPTVLLGYQYKIGRWWKIDQACDVVLTTLESGTSLDNPNTLGPLDMDIPAPAGLGDVNLDTLALSVIEDFAIFRAGTQIVATYTGAGATPSYIETGDYELPEQRRHLINWVRPIWTGDVESATAWIAVRNVPERNPPWPNYDLLGPRNLNTTLGTIPFRACGRYMRLLFEMSGPILEFQGFDPNVRPMGLR